MQPIDYVIFLGAGASYVHGAPLTKDLLPYFFEHIDSSDKRQRLLSKFIRDVFKYNPKRKSKDNFPNIVDMLSLVDIAIDKHENLSKTYDFDELSKVREALEYSIFRALEHSLSYGSTDRRSKASMDLLKKLKGKTTVVVSCNYDVIIDIAIARRDDPYFTFDRADIETIMYGPEQPPIDYGIDFANVRRPFTPDPNINDVKLYKIHGSFNWLWSKVTGNLYYGGLNKSVGLTYDISQYYDKATTNDFDEKLRDLQPILITPTHLKDLRNSYIASVWRKAEDAIRRTQNIIFIGYSMPADDIYIKYLVKHAIETSVIPKQITVVDYSNKPMGKRTEVENNYKRTLGSKIQYYRYGFEKFVQDKL